MFCLPLPDNALHVLTMSMFVGVKLLSHFVRIVSPLSHCGFKFCGMSHDEGKTLLETLPYG